MDTPELFAAALGLTDPWYIDRITLDPDARRLELRIDFRRGGTFACAECGTAGCKAYDTTERRWRHLDFFQFRTTLVARVPRVQCPSCGIQPTRVSWARPGSGFTLWFEAVVLTLVAQMPVAAVARLVGERDTRLWRLLHYHVEEARTRRSDRRVRTVGIDETAARRGHDYITLFVDMEAEPKARVLFATPGKDATTVACFAEDLRAHGGKPDKIVDVSCDMSAAILAGIAASLPTALVTLDRFHVQRLVSQAVDETRRAERATAPVLKGQRYALLRKLATLNEAQLGFIAALVAEHGTLKTARAYHLKLAFEDFFRQPARRAKAFLTRWCAWAQRSRVPAMVRVARTFRTHAPAILRWHLTGITNGVLEGINSLVQAAKAKARGYRTVRNLIAMTYLLAGRLDYSLTHMK